MPPSSQALSIAEKWRFKHVVYGLVDPRTDAIRYIGSTWDLKSRLWEHLNTPPGRKDHPRWLWLLELKAAGLEPMPVVLRQCGGKRKAREVETNVIRTLSQAGADLLNFRGARPSEADERKHLKHSQRMKEKWAEIKAAGHRTLREAAEVIPAVVPKKEE